MTRRASVFCILFILSSHYFYILSSKPVPTDITRSSLKPTFFLSHYYFRCWPLKKNPYHTCTTHTKHTWLSGGFTTQQVSRKIWGRLSKKRPRVRTWWGLYCENMNLKIYICLLQRIKGGIGGEEGKRCRCSERRRSKVGGDRILSHTRWRVITNV